MALGILHAEGSFPESKEYAGEIANDLVWIKHW